MKKNLRIVSAAAAALLAVAPVAATVVPAANTVVSAATNDAGNLTYPALPAAGGHFTKPSDSKDAIYVNPSELSSQGIATALKNALVKANKLSTALDVTDVHNVGTNNYSFKLKTNQLWGGLTEAQRKTIIQGNYSTRPMPASNAAGTELAGTWYVTITTEPVKAEVAERIKDGAFFEANDEDAYANGQNYYANAEDSNFPAKTSLSDLKKRIMKVVSLKNAGMTSEKAYDTYVWGHATTDDNLIGQLTRQGISVSADKTFDPAGKAFHIVVSTNGLPDITVHFQNTGYVDQDAPVLLANYSNIEGSVDANKVNNHVRPRNLSAVVDANGYVRPLIIRQHDDGTFQPTEWFSAWNSNKSKAFISITATDNNVDWTKPGLYSVTISATNAAGKTSKAVVPVIVSAKNGNVMTVVKNTNLYTEQNGAMVQANLVSYQEVVNPGHQLVVYGAPVTKKLNGQDVQMYRVFGPNENFWVPADALKNGVVNTPAAQETTKTVTIMHIAAIYDKNGVATHDPALRAYDTYSVVAEPVTINGAKFYKLAGKDQYIKVGNVDGTSRTLKHNSYVYKSTGKRANKKTLKKGSSVTTYGKSFMIAGHQMYRIGKNQYVKKANF